MNLRIKVVSDFECMCPNSTEVYQLSSDNKWTPLMSIFLYMGAESPKTGTEKSLKG